MSFLETVDKARAFLERHGRVSLRALQREFNLDDDALDELIEELAEIQRVAVRDGPALAWAGGLSPAPTESAAREREPRDYTPKHLADKILQSKSAMEGERKQVTVLFADVKGSLELAEQVDPEEWHRILDRFFQILADGVHRFEGTVNQYTGDGIMALFGAPIAHEDHAQRACWAALHLRDELRRYANELRMERGLSFATRIGLNSGDVVVGKIGDDLRMDYTAQGHTVGLAARMQEVAEPGQAYLSEETARRVRGYFELEDLARVRVKGASNAVGIFALRGLGRVRSRLELSRARGFSKFVGRADEMALLEAALERAAKGAPERVGIVGEAGVGKSRLCHEFCERARARGVRVTIAQCVAHGKKVPLLPWMSALRNYFGITDRDPDDVARDRVTGRMVRLGASLEEDVPFMLDFLGVPDPAHPIGHMDADTRRRRLRDLVARLRSARERDEPAIFLWEDLHWIDASSESLLFAVEEDAESHRTLALLTFRPEYRPKTSSGVGYRHIPLRPLEPASTHQLLGDLVGSELAAGPLAQAIQERAAGNPFFVEEIVQSLVESGTLRGTRGAYELTGPVDAIAIPDSVQAVLAARIDRLGEHEKALLQTASIIGRSFALPLLTGLSGTPERELEAILRRLLEAEFIYEEAIYPEIEYAFRHPLTQEVAYDSQLGERRRLLHGRLADLLREHHRDRLDENAALLAHHLEQAGRLADAAVWHACAAEWLERRDVSEGMRHWRRVIEIEDGLPQPARDGELHARAYVGTLHLCWRMSSSKDEAWELLERGLAVADRIGSPRLRAKMLIPYAVICGMYGDERERIRWSREALDLARSQGDRELELSARVPLGSALVLVGPLQEALDVIDEGLGATSPEEDLGRQDWDFHPYAYLLAVRSLVGALLGEHERARRDAERAVELVRPNGSSDDLLLSHFYASMAAEVRGDLTKVLHHATESLGAAKKRASPGTTGMALMAAGQAYLLGGALEDAIEHLENAWPEELGGEGFSGRISTLAQTHLTLGDLEKSRDWTERGISQCREAGYRLDAIRVHLVTARLLLHPEVNGSPEDIEADIERADALVRETGARGLLPRVLEVRAELARREGNGAEAERLLREAHRLYTEMGATGHAERLARELGL